MGYSCTTLIPLNSDLIELGTYDLLVSTNTVGWISYALTNKRISDYRFIKIEVSNSSGLGSLGGNIVSREIFENITSVNDPLGCFVLGTGGTSEIYSGFSTYIDDTHINVYSNATTCYVKVYGIE